MDAEPKQCVAIHHTFDRKGRKKVGYFGINSEKDSKTWAALELKSFSCSKEAESVEAWAMHVEINDGRIELAISRTNVGYRCTRTRRRVAVVIHERFNA